MRLVIVTGMSGGGRATAMRMLEDAGYYCVDNMPVPLVEKFMELLNMPGNEISKAALGLDVRGSHDFTETTEILDDLRDRGYSFEILFMDASDQTLLMRYKETRRMHPLSTTEDPSIENGIRRERQIMAGMKKRADYVIDSSKLLTRQLKEEVDRIFVANEEYNSLMVNVISFGFKHGIPADADLVFDVRFLPNPYYVEELRSHTGNEACIQDFVLGFPESGEFLDKLEDMLQFLIPNYIKEGKNQLVIAIGCTGGQHRSVTLANKLYERLRLDKGSYGLTINHRDCRN